MYQFHTNTQQNTKKKSKKKIKEKSKQIHPTRNLEESGESRWPNNAGNDLIAKTTQNKPVPFNAAILHSSILHWLDHWEIILFFWHKPTSHTKPTSFSSSSFCFLIHLSLPGHWGPFTWVKQPPPQEQRYPFLPVWAVFSSILKMVWHGVHWHWSV